MTDQAPVQTTVPSSRFIYVSSYIVSLNRSHHPWSKIKMIMMMYPFLLASEFEVFHCKFYGDHINEFRNLELQATLAIVPSTEAEYHMSIRTMLKKICYGNLYKLLDSFKQRIVSSNTNEEHETVPDIADNLNTDFHQFALLPLELQDHIFSFLPNSHDFLIVSKTLSKFYIDNRKEALFSPYKPTDIQKIRRLPKKINSISLGPIKRIDNETLEYIKKLPLKKFSCAESPHNEDGHHAAQIIFNAIKSKPLTKLCMPQCFIENFTEGVDFSRITKLDISGMNLPTEQLSIIFDGQRNFLELILAGNFIDTPIIKKIVVHKTITHLNLGFCLINHNDVKEIAIGLPNIEFLDMSYSLVNGSFSTMEYLLKLTNLKTLILRGWYIVEVHVGFFVGITKVRNLRTLDLRLCLAITKQNLIEMGAVIGEQAIITADGVRFGNLNILCDDETLLHNNNPLALQLRDMTNYAKRIRVLSLCRYIFPPLCRNEHREEFLSILKSELMLKFINNERYLVPRDYLSQIHPGSQIEAPIRHN